jgi:hypothetical protein
METNWILSRTGWIAGWVGAYCWGTGGGGGSAVVSAEAGAGACVAAEVGADGS